MAEKTKPEGRVPLLLLGAGASADAGLPPATGITQHLQTLTEHTSWPRARLIEGVFRAVQLRIAHHERLPPPDVDFEAVVGAIADAVDGRNPFARDGVVQVLTQHFGTLDLEDLLLSLLLYIRGLLLPVGDTGYLDVLLQEVWEGDGAIATLNYDVCVERRHIELGRDLNTGFGSDGRWHGFGNTPQGTELLKLHGSVQWLRQSVRGDDPDSILDSLALFSEPFSTALSKPAAWVPGEVGGGVRPLMNIGIAKEQLYVTPPFNEIVHRFQARLVNADIIIVAGYSFRDQAVNRMLLDSLKRKKVPVVIVNPGAHLLVSENPVCQALHDYGVVIQCTKELRELAPSDVDEWRRAVVAEGVTRSRHRRTNDGRRALDRTRHVVVDLCLVEYYLRLTLAEIDAGREIRSGVLNALVQTLGRCIGSHIQAVLASGVNVDPEPALHGVYSRGAVNLSANREALADCLRSIQQIIQKLEVYGTPDPLENQKLYESGELSAVAQRIVAELQRAGAEVPWRRVAPRKSSDVEGLPMNERREWKRVLQSLTMQAEYLNEFAPGQPKAAFGAMDAHFQAALKEFRSNPSLDAAIAIDETLQWLIRRAVEAFGSPVDSGFQEWRKRTFDALEEVRSKVREQAERE